MSLSSPQVFLPQLSLPSEMRELALRLPDKAMPWTDDDSSSRASMPSAPEQAPSASEQCCTFSREVAHDLANILMAIQCNMELMLLQPTQNSSTDRLHNTISASQRAQELLRSILKKEFHEGPLTQKQEVNVCVLVDEIVDLFKATLPSSIEVKKVKVLSTGKVRGYPTELFRMLNNLLSNAAHAMHGQNEGLLTVMLDQVLDPKRLPFVQRTSSTYLRIRVQDTGAGIPASLGKKIFDPYFTTKLGGKGLGLGLSVVKKVVAKHEGVLTVDSYPKCGSIFTVYLPQIGGLSL